MPIHGNRPDSFVTRLDAALGRVFEGSEADKWVVVTTDGSYVSPPQPKRRAIIAMRELQAEGHEAKILPARKAHALR